MRVDSVSFFNPDARKVLDDKHPCPKCGNEMYENIKEIGGGTYITVAYHCPKCGHSEQVKQ